MYKKKKNYSYNINTKTKQTFKNIAKVLEGKEGQFRKNLLGKNIEFCGRSVITVEPNLHINECGIPYEIAIELFQPFLIKKLIQIKFTNTIREAKSKIIKNLLIIKKILLKLSLNLRFT